jgi:hypothetical protein
MGSLSQSDSPHLLRPRILRQPVPRYPAHIIRYSSRTGEPRPESGQTSFCRHIRHCFSGKSGCFLQNQTSFSALFPKNFLSGIFRNCNFSRTDRFFFLLKKIAQFRYKYLDFETVYDTPNSFRQSESIFLLPLHTSRL